VEWEEGTERGCRTWKASGIEGNRKEEREGVGEQAFTPFCTEIWTNL
jgi:hypothetical protein